MKVQATRLGYYDDKRVQEGQVFTLKPRKMKDGQILTVEKQFSSRWMKSLEEDVSEVKPNKKESNFKAKAKNEEI